MPSRRSAPLLVPLACPSCGSALDPLPDDVVFLCPECAGASELHGTLAVRRVLRALACAPATLGLTTGSVKEPFGVDFAGGGGTGPVLGGSSRSEETFPAAGGRPSPLAENGAPLPTRAAAAQVGPGAKTHEPGEVLYLPFWEFPAIAITPAFNGSRLLTLTRWYTERVSALAGQSGGGPRGLWGGRIGSDDARRILSLFEEPDPGAERTPEDPRPPARRAAGGPEWAGINDTERGVDPAHHGAPVVTRRGGPGGGSPPPTDGSCAGDRAVPGVPPRSARGGPPHGASARLPDPSLLAIPFVAGENRLVCVATGLHVYFETLEGARDLIDRWRRPAS